MYMNSNGSMSLHSFISGSHVNNVFLSPCSLDLSEAVTNIMFYRPKCEFSPYPNQLYQRMDGRTTFFFICQRKSALFHMNTKRCQCSKF